MSTKSPIIGAVEIGNATVKVLVGEYKRRNLHILAQAEGLSRGVSKGTIVDYKAACARTHDVLAEAEQRAGRRIDYVFLAQTGGHIEGSLHASEIAVKSRNGKVSKRHIDRASILAKTVTLPPGRVMIHHLRRPFFLDGREVAGSPVGRVGRRLAASYWNMHGAMSKISDAIHVINGYKLQVRELVLSSLASAATVTTATQRRRGVLVIDIGAGTTDYVLFCHDHVCCAGVLPVGGMHLTNDLALGLHLTTMQAEKLKRPHGCAQISTGAKDKEVWLHGNQALGDRQIPRRAIEQITAARTEEIFEILKTILGDAFTPKSCAAGVVLTGGTSRLRGIARCARKVLGVPTRLGAPPQSVKGELRNPSFSTTLGLFYYLLPI